MAKLKPEVEWFTATHTFDAYGVLCLDGRWAAVKKVWDERGYEVLTEWLADRKTAIGFLKLLKET